MDSTGDLALSYLAALLVTLFFEMPFAEIKKHVTAALKKSRSREDNLQKLDNKKSD
jgi:peptidoglycan/LPS O-acetylase OafA/YrhL